MVVICGVTIVELGHWQFIVERLTLRQRVLTFNNDESKLFKNWIMSNEVHFDTSGYVNKQSSCFWESENWKLYRGDIVGPFFFEDDDEMLLQSITDKYQPIRLIFDIKNNVLYSLRKNANSEVRIFKLSNVKIWLFDSIVPGIFRWYNTMENSTLTKWQRFKSLMSLIIKRRNWTNYRLERVEI